MHFYLLVTAKICVRTAIKKAKITYLYKDLRQQDYRRMNSKDDNIKTNIEEIKRIEKELEIMLNQGDIDSHIRNRIKNDLNNVKLKRIEKEMQAFGIMIPPTAATAAEIGEE
jgi:hypothetical protein